MTPCVASSGASKEAPEAEPRALPPPCRKTITGWWWAGIAAAEKTLSVRQSSLPRSWFAALNWTHKGPKAEASRTPFQGGTGAGARYGDEIDFGVRASLTARLSLELQYGDYRADSFTVSQRKLWLLAEYRYGKQTM